MTTKVECDQAGGTIKFPLTTAEFVWDGGCGNYADIQSESLATGQTIDSCNLECHKLDWCTHIFLQNENGKCWLLAPGCTKNDAP